MSDWNSRLAKVCHDGVLLHQETGKTIRFKCWGRDDADWINEYMDLNYPKIPNYVIYVEHNNRTLERGDLNVGS